MVGHSIENMGRLLLQVLGRAEDDISGLQAFLAGITVFALLLLLITILASLS